MVAENPSSPSARCRFANFVVHPLFSLAYTASFVLHSHDQYDTATNFSHTSDSTFALRKKPRWP